MREKIPASPFATRFSGPTREIETRLRSLFQKKRRPPVALVALLLAAAVGCGGLVSCQGGEAQPVGWALRTQYYDVYENYIELPVLTVPEGRDLPGAAEANGLLDDLAAEYSGLLSDLEGLAAEPEGTSLLRHRCVLYPSETERYINLLLWRWDLYEDVIDDRPGRFFSVVYDKEEDRVVTLEDALALAGDLPAGAEPAAFRMDGDGRPVFYSAGKEAGAAVSRGSIWRPEEEPVEWDPTIVDGPRPVPGEELSRRETPLWWEWSGTGEGPAGGYADPINEALPQAQRAFLDGAQAALDGKYVLEDLISPIRRELLAWVDGGRGTVLGAARVTDRLSTGLVLAAADAGTGEIREGSVFCEMGYPEEHPETAVFQRDGADFLLYVHNSAHMGYVYGQAGLVRFDGEDFTWTWPVEGDVREEGSPACEAYGDYWEHHLARLCPGGVELFTEDLDLVPGGDQWRSERRELFS